jgi:hypothetical protein
MDGHRTGAWKDSEGILSVLDWATGIDRGLMVRLFFLLSVLRGCFACGKFPDGKGSRDRFDTSEQFPQPRTLKKEVCDTNFVQTVYCFFRQVYCCDRGWSSWTVSVVLHAGGCLSQRLAEARCRNTCTSGDARAVEISSRAQWHIDNSKVRLDMRRHQ